MNLESQNLEDYLISDTIVDWKTPDVQQLAKDLTVSIFSTEKEQLAFHMDALSGEFIYNTIFSSPVSNVVNKLKKYKSRRDLWLDLPKVLELHT